jgi:hypothetical protein
MKKLVVYLTGILMVIAFTLPSCNNDIVDDSISDLLKCTTDTTHEVCGDVKTVDLYGGQHILVGDVEISNDGVNLYVTYHAAEGWSFTDLHLYVGDISLMPHNKSMNPTIGHFPYKVEGLPYPTVYYTFTIPLATLPKCFEVVAHAVVRNGKQSETAYLLEKLFTTAFGIGHWGGYASYCKGDCELKCESKKAWVDGVQRAEIPFKGYYNAYTTADTAVVANIIDFSSRKPGATIGTVTYTDDGVNMIVNVSMLSGYYLSMYLAYLGSNEGFAPYISTIGGVITANLPINGTLSYGISNYTYTVPLSSLTKNEDGSIMIVQFMYICDPV